MGQNRNKSYANSQCNNSGSYADFKSWHRKAARFEAWGLELMGSGFKDGLRIESPKITRLFLMPAM